MLSSALYHVPKTDRLLDPLPARLQNYRVGSLDYYEPHFAVSDLHRAIVTDSGRSFPSLPRTEFHEGQGMLAKDMLGYLATYRAGLVSNLCC